MDKKKWMAKIRKATKEINTYKPAFEPVITALAEILEKRDEVYENYDGVPIVQHTNSHGETNRMKNPALMLWDDFNKTAIVYWRELGLTPSGLKKIKATDEDPKTKNSPLVQILTESKAEKQ